MGHLYNFKYKISKISKINYFSYKMWRSIYLIKSNPVHMTSERKIRYRSTTIPLLLKNSEIFIHSGNKWHKKVINNWLVGFKAGEFTWNRKIALYKSKQKKKKK